MAQIPGVEFAVVPMRKLTAYLLDPDHPTGGSKAIYFRGMGFDDSNVEHFKDELIRHANRFDVRDVTDSPYGPVYAVIGQLNGPFRSGTVKSVWIIPNGTTVPRFVTAYPEHE